MPEVARHLSLLHTATASVGGTLKRVDDDLMHQNKKTGLNRATLGYGLANFWRKQFLAQFEGPMQQPGTGRLRSGASSSLAICL
jgi:hypothetical protein